MPVDLRLTRSASAPRASAAASPSSIPTSSARTPRGWPRSKALGDPIRLRLVDVLRRHAGEVCVCELVPLFGVSQPTLSHHLSKLRAAGIVDCERCGLWAYYYVRDDALTELSTWLS